MKHFKKLILGFGALALVAGVNLGCETTKGAGEDIQNAGEAMEDAVD
jgi:predicted small secreted protein